MHAHCARCRRPVKTENVVTVEGRGYGRRCSEKVGDLLTQPTQRVQITSRKRKPRGNDKQVPLFTEATAC